MKICILVLVSFTGNLLFGQKEISDTIKTIRLDEVEIFANRLSILLKNNPGAISLVTPEILSNMTKSTGAEEALRLIPGVRIDNQHDGERVHVSILGQGILTERGLRGIGVLIDGIPVNDPTGFGADLKWQNIELYKLQSASNPLRKESIDETNIETKYY
jgi:outer membrane receptor for ferrienterochelin and colicin